jgi:hypothetical protein
MLPPSCQEHLFELGDRASILQEQDKAIIPHIAEQEGKRFLYEVIFKYVCMCRPGLTLSEARGCSQ